MPASHYLLPFKPARCLFGMADQPFSPGKSNCRRQTLYPRNALPEKQKTVKETAVAKLNKMNGSQ